MSERDQPPAIDDFTRCHVFTLSKNVPDSTSTSATSRVTPSAPVVSAHIGSGLLEVSGDDALTFLHGQLSSDVQALAAGQGQYWSYNSPKGRMLANGVLWRPVSGPPGRVMMLLASDLAETIRRRLSMFVLRAKVAIQDARDRYAMLGLAGAGGADAAREALGIAVAPLAAVPFNGDASALALPDGRIVVTCPVASAPIIHAALARHAATADAEMWRWFTIAAGVPVITAATSDLFVPQAANWDLLGGVNFQKGCYPGQEIVARMHYLGRLKERLFAFRTGAENITPAARLYSTTFGNEQACGTVVNAASDPAGGSVLLAVVQQAAVDANDVRLHAPDGPSLVRQPLPYAVPDAAAARAPRTV
jgi:folate-binding protein YgfZ